MELLLFIIYVVFCFSKMVKFYHYPYFKAEAMLMSILTQVANLTVQFNQKTSHQFPEW